jgi:hypothetical protein
MIPFLPLTRSLLFTVRFVVRYTIVLYLHHTTLPYMNTHQEHIQVVIQYAMDRDLATLLQAAGVRCVSCLPDRFFVLHPKNVSAGANEGDEGDEGGNKGQVNQENQGHNSTTASL